MDNHRTGDNICIFGGLFRGLLIDNTDGELGFSRGAYTARWLI
jgi:uncharacterized protein (DUF2235 family)